MCNLLPLSSTPLVLGYQLPVTLMEDSYVTRIRWLKAFIVTKSIDNVEEDEGFEPRYSIFQDSRGCSLHFLEQIRGPKMSLY